MIEDVLWNLRGKTLGILGLAFKGNTDDMRFAPSIDIIEALQKGGVKIQAYDPQAVERAKEIFKNVKYTKTPYEVCKNADAVAVLTDWPEFRDLDWKKVHKLLRHPVVFDGRNLYDPKKMRKAGFNYYSIGRNGR